MDLTIERLFASPDHYLFAFEGDQAIFRTMDRDAYHRSIFLDRRIAAVNEAEVRVPVEALTAFRDSHAIVAPRTAWIFHVAHCGSTLLARALDRPEHNLVLREPRPLRQLGLTRDPAGNAWRARLRLAAAMAGRRYRPDAATIVKANVPVNFILADLLALDPPAPAILLYFPLRAYLLAVLRSPGHRQWVVNVTTQLEPVLSEELAGLDVAERAAALWLTQMRIYAEALARYPGTRSLHADALLDMPRPALAAAAAHFGVGLAAAERDAIVAGELFATYSKSPGLAFDNDARLSLRAENARMLGPEIERARRWVDGRPLPARLDRPLVGSSPPLLDD
ncbi:MAG TPA: hypothetical protein VMS43_09170 [Allosphingosinicella sp.]|nr:hypothetical protein [Allosphingosinicella sp.]